MLEEIFNLLSNFSSLINTFLEGVINAAFVVVDMLNAVVRLFSWSDFLPPILFMCMSTIICIGIVKLIFGR